MLTAIIVAAGSSRRMGCSDKLWIPLANKPLIAHSLSTFAAAPDVGEILLVVRPEQVDRFKTLLNLLALGKIVRLVPGGRERCHSVWNGLQALPETCSFVAVHDGARPLVSQRAISGCYALAKKTGAASCAIPVTDTLKKVRNATETGLLYISGGVERSQLWAMQTPQIFSRNIIVNAYQRMLEADQVLTDETSAVQEAGGEVAIFYNEDWNPKITYPNDVKLAEYMLTASLADGQSVA